MNICPEPHHLIDAAFGIPTPHDAHIAACAACQAEIAELNATRSALANLPPAASAMGPVTIRPRRPVPYGAIAAGIALMLTFLIGFRFEVDPDGGWRFSVGIVRTTPVAATIPESDSTSVPLETVRRMQADQLAAITSLIRETRERQSEEFGALLTDYATLAESRRSVDYGLIQLELDDLRARTDDHLYRTNLVMVQLLNQLTYITPEDH